MLYISARFAALDAFFYSETLTFFSYDNFIEGQKSRHFETNDETN